MRKVDAEKYRNFDFSDAWRGAVAKAEPGKTKISIRLDNSVLEYFRSVVDQAGGGNYQTLINDALLEYVHRRSTLEIVREVVREELAPYVARRKSGAPKAPQKGRPRRSNASAGVPGLPGSRRGNVLKRGQQKV